MHPQLYTGKIISYIPGGYGLIVPMGESAHVLAQGGQIPLVTFSTLDLSWAIQGERTTVGLEVEFLVLDRGRSTVGTKVLKANCVTLIGTREKTQKFLPSWVGHVVGYSIEHAAGAIAHFSPGDLEILTRVKTMGHMVAFYNSDGTFEIELPPEQKKSSDITIPSTNQDIHIPSFQTPILVAFTMERIDIVAGHGYFEAVNVRSLSQNEI